MQNLTFECTLQAESKIAQLLLAAGLQANQNLKDNKKEFQRENAELGALYL